MHVQLVGSEVDARIDLQTLAVVAGSVPPGLLAEVQIWLAANQAALIKEWKKWPR